MTLQLLEPPTQENCITFYGVSWEQFERIEVALEGITGVRLTYLDGTLDIMAPLSPEHEDSKSTIGLLLEAYLRENRIRFYVRGGPTLGSRAVGARGEPDESYNLETKKDIPDIAIEVVITSGGVDKLEKYKRWRVPEVWFWHKGKLAIYCLREQEKQFEYQKLAGSEFLPELDLVLLENCANRNDQYDAVNEFTQAIRQE
ncbi:MAG: Uma2 family endonuclease [Symploca sp. SIO3C6]|uniref:Uma2 family endonuclease n=1 Tax=Symploca sp. SIO1C4 TaxID=2607765 RepID=A0A6B3N3K9_9CYAN|nr:Uma2 family endonuclease [Symploca sp. SIO3C6]NEO98696.1 Uma2 family endonuclease [Symploca sp. SIO2E9]NER26157.1 Uma2 family endonuclease [Symploca sp. SIO1C4]